MPIRTPALVSVVVARASVAALCLCLGACAAPPRIEAPAAVAQPPPAREASAPVVAPEPVRETAAAPVPPPRAAPPSNIVVLFDSDTRGYAELAAEIAERLPNTRYRASLVPVRAAGSSELLAPLVALRPAIAVAVGRGAADLAREHLPATPLVYCEVEDADRRFAAVRNAWGVRAAPPGARTEVARRVHGVLDRVASGATSGLPRVTPIVSQRASQPAQAVQADPDTRSAR